MKPVLLISSLALVVVLLASDGTARVPAASEAPTVNVPVRDREPNWIGREGNGSCVHASFITLLRWQGKVDFADYWRGKYDSGETPSEFNRHLNAERVRYAVTTSGDVSFLEWALRTRRGACVVSHGGAHMETLVHLDATSAGLIDNNSPAKFRWIPREQFLAEWREGPNGGWAVTPVYTPAAPLPR
jgi:hypothetical protein